MERYYERDGKVQMSFVLPVPNNDRGVEALLSNLLKWGFMFRCLLPLEALDKTSHSRSIRRKANHTV